MSRICGNYIQIKMDIQWIQRRIQKWNSNEQKQQKHQIKYLIWQEM
ncbi:unnamed protein product [Paramecium sonneborni]|uniref:Uncharacterized protein n=1 Tax=Paramecium sonneborni TaxID=65129 RepID=A0A8S1MCB6_9CILI|nr:unnamed protein product [Paramecium sonneborni]